MKITVSVKSQKENRGFFFFLVYISGSKMMISFLRLWRYSEHCVNYYIFVSLVFDCLLSLLLSQDHESKREIQLNIRMYWEKEK